MADNSNSSGNQSSGQKPSLSWSQPATPQASTTKPVTPVQPKPAAHNSGTQGAAASQGSSAMGTYVGIFVAGLIVGALVGWGIASSNNGSLSTTASSTNMTASSTTAEVNSTQGAAAATTNSDQSITGKAGNVALASTEQAGFAVAVSKVSVSQPTWLVVYEDNNGTPGNAIGAGLFFPDGMSGTIELLRATLPGKSYLVGQSLDDGDKIFSLATDKPVRDEKGNPLFTEFVAR